MVGEAGDGGPAVLIGSNFGKRYGELVPGLLECCAKTPVLFVAATQEF